jgi:ferrochelatase
VTRRTGVLVLSYGTPSSRDEIAGYYTRIRHGRPPSTEQLADLQRRYDAIGGLSPLRVRTDEQVQGLATVLDSREPGRHVVVGATKYASPSIEEGVATLLAAGVDEVVGLVLAPLAAEASTGQYHERAAAALGGRVPYRPVWSWWDAPGFAALLAHRVTDALGGGAAVVLFTAHSLPLRTVADGDYLSQLGSLASQVATAAGVADHLVCWQSAGKTGDEWLGPDVLEVIRALDPRAAPSVVVCPAGFVSDHLEVLYDLDVDATKVAEERGIELRRTASLNDDRAFLGVLAAVVAGALAA